MLFQLDNIETIWFKLRKPLYLFCLFAQTIAFPPVELVS